jgi:hypothetical protein
MAQRHDLAWIPYDPSHPIRREQRSCRWVKLQVQLEQIHPKIHLAKSGHGMEDLDLSAHN